MPVHLHVALCLVAQAGAVILEKSQYAYISRAHRLHAHVEFVKQADHASSL